MRKPYIDKLRNLTILLLFPVHTFMIWNDFGSKFYIWQGEEKILSTLIVLVNPWFMPVLFVLAGVSARYALKKYTVGEFLIQRVKKLLIPFLFGVVAFIPFQTLYARKFFDHYEGVILENLQYFFTHLTDFSGYDGAFTPGHLWFILFLFLISIMALVPFHFLPYERISKRVEQMPVFGVFCLFLPIWLMYYLGNFGGYSIGKNFALYLAGYYVLSNDSVMEKLEKSIKWLSGLCLIETTALVVLYYKFSYYGDLWVNFIGWNWILVLLVLAKKYLNKSTGFTRYFNRASYPVYILHQSILVVLAYYVVKNVDGVFLQTVFICMGSFGLTILAYHLIRQIPFIRNLIGANNPATSSGAWNLANYPRK